MGRPAAASVFSSEPGAAGAIGNSFSPFTFESNA